MDPLLWLSAAAIVAAILVSIPLLQRLFLGKREEPVQDGRDDGRVENEPVIIGRGRRARRQQQEGEERGGEGEGEREEAGENEEGGDFELGKKIGTKKRRKLQEKAEKKALREQEQALREDEKKREARRVEEMKKREEEEEAMRLKKEKEEKERKELQEKQEEEEYMKLKASFIVEEEGFVDEGLTDTSLAEFIDYIKTAKVVYMEEVAAQFGLKTQVVIERIQTLQSSGELTGVIDDRGKFIYITMDELKSVAKFMKQRGRVSLTELAQSSNNLIKVQS
ncbi:PREDICTED: DDRGK domain-containing protein 1-like [Amphimedon queenslandica]|uniref:DDRGK domain-containing protein 1 n=1 Tax=Amphimedon queenslandica TaxID=400682 RepID=A0A1X7VKY2_AMPQE|nr:PREDICTED: DDRGK domain-containing protein 1-like [Amphimedon queenslandica]|eukprot:XP_011409928.1 PREDICTED: DDRGK domain-containing protein 1-like [Amphimedon queenslandica]